MNKKIQTAMFARLLVGMAFLCCMASPTVVFARAKQYPIQGTVTALGTNQEMTGGGSGSVMTHEHRTYTVKTPTLTFVLECPHWMDGFHIHAPSECGG